MTSDCPGKWRFNLVFGLLMLAVTGLGVRLWWLMGRLRPDALRLAQKQQQKTTPLPARVGNIYLRTRGRYVLLAGSREIPLCYVDPTLVQEGKLAEAAIRIARAVDGDPVEIQYDLLESRESRYVAVKRDLTAGQVDAVAALGMPAVGVAHEWRRIYPNGELAATVVGFRRRDGFAGGGLESSQEEHLKAIPGRRVVLADARRRPIWPLPDLSRTPQDGRSVFLCLDAAVQRTLQEAVAEAVGKFGAQWGAGIVVDPYTGEILAMCSVPTFNPNEYSKAGADRQTNRVVSVPYEPGSVAKPIFAAAAVDAGVVTYQTPIFTENGVYHAPRGGTISDHGNSYGTITVARGVVVSSNILMAKVGEKLGNRRLHDVLMRFGLGHKTGIELPGESAGIVRDLNKWDGYSLRRVSFGQEVSCTTLQLAMAFCALANGGLLLRPRLVDQVADPSGQIIWTSKREVVRRVLHPDVAAETLGVMQEVVESGTGKACKLDRWTSFGKTGTAQIPGRGGYVSGAYTASFLGGAPATRPRVICLISIYYPDKTKGYYGAKVAAPYVKQVLERTLLYLNVPPDKVKDPAGQTAHRPGRATLARQRP